MVICKRGLDFLGQVVGCGGNNDMRWRRALVQVVESKGSIRVVVGEQVTASEPLASAFKTRAKSVHS